jgi:glutathione reductase (NADPH)
VKSYDAVIVGSGTGGQTAAYSLMEYGLNVAVIENSRTAGGICALAGCQAKKWFYEAAEIMDRARHLTGKGVVRPPEISWGDVRDQKNAFTQKVPDSTIKGFKGSGIDYIEGTALFLDENTLAVNGEKIKAGYIVLATGASPMPLPFDGANFMISSTEFLELKELPPRIAFVGGGFISFEFAHFAARLGPEKSQIYILEAGPRPLGPFDGEMVEKLMAASAADGIQIHVNVEITGIEKNKKGFSVYGQDGSVFDVDLVVHGAGRAPAIKELRLEKANVASTGKGITVDRTMRTTNSQVFAVGDCAATIQLARVADYEAKVAAVNIAAEINGGKKSVMDYSRVPAVLFTLPQYAMVGSTEDELKKKGFKYYKSTGYNLSWPTYRRVGLRHAGYKILVDEKNQILGAHIISDNAAGLINIFRQAMIYNQPVEEIYRNHIMSPYPTRESDVIYMLKALMDDDFPAG